MTNKRDCETCAHAQPFGGENDNRCDAWECEFIDRKEAIEAYKASHQIEIDIVRCGECKWGEELAPEIIYCDDMVGGAMRRTDFCSYGERRTDE